MMLAPVNASTHRGTGVWRTERPVDLVGDGRVADRHVRSHHPRC